jgi:LysR family transcriptional regulator, glycine cleavage system transcriptional activator
MTYLLPPLNPLRAFEAAARHRSFKLAAHELRVTPGAVGQQVKILEDRLGVRLFERLHKQLTLTPAGQEYVAAVQTPTLPDASCVSRAPPSDARVDCNQFAVSCPALTLCLEIRR